MITIVLGSNCWVGVERRREQRERTLNEEAQKHLSQLLQLVLTCLESLSPIGKPGTQSLGIRELLKNEIRVSQAL